MKFLVKLEFLKDPSNYTPTLNFESPLAGAPCEILIHSANAIMKLTRCKLGETVFKYISQNRKEIRLTMDPKDSLNTYQDQFGSVTIEVPGNPLILMKSKLKMFWKPAWLGVMVEI